ncbi:VanZ family protein [Eubacteriaceae bacterium ES2]|nr:VanZ family protein [Eubacteriaceae bacterium ES2]
MKMIKKYSWWILSFLWMGMIFFSSSQTGEISGSLSSGLSSIIMKEMENLFAVHLNLQAVDYIMRKNAHFFVYLLLGIFFYLALANSKTSRPALKALLFSLLYAISDECHQLFINGRAGRATDILIDTMGALIGVLLIRALKKHQDQSE